MGHFTADPPARLRLPRPHVLRVRRVAQLDPGRHDGRTGATRSRARRAQSVAHKLGLFVHLVGSTVWSQLENIPIYDLKAFTRHLDTPSGGGTRTTRPRCAPSTAGTASSSTSSADNFAYFTARGVSLELQAAEVLFVRRDSFLDDAANGQAAGRVVDRPELHRPADLRPQRPTTTIRRRTSTPGRGSCSTCSRRSSNSPQLGGHGARDHLRRARRLLRPRHPPPVPPATAAGTRPTACACPRS